MRAEFCQQRAFPQIGLAGGGGGSSEQFDLRRNALAGALSASVRFIHQNFPGQFRHVATDLARSPGWRVLAIGQTSSSCTQGEGVTTHRDLPYRA